MEEPINPVSPDEALKAAIIKKKKGQKKQKRRRARSARLEWFTPIKAFKFTYKHIWPILVPFAIVVIFLIILPLVSILLYSIIQPTGDALKFKTSFENFINMFTNSNIMIALLLSIAYAVAAAFVAIAIGYPIAYILTNLPSKAASKNLWILITMPIWISMLLKVLGLQSFFYLVAPRALGTPFAIIVGLVYMFLPFAIIPIHDQLEARDRDQEDAAQDLGMSKTATFWKVIVRNSISGILTAFTLVVVQAATSLIIVRYMGNGKVTLISSIIESYFFKGNNFGFGAAISVFLTVLVFLLTWVVNIVSRRLTGGKDGKSRWRNSSKSTILPL